MSEELKPCPFCGREAGLDQVESAAGNGRMMWIIGCTNYKCEITFQGHARKVDAINAWNARTDNGKPGEVARLRAENERLREALAEITKGEGVFNIDQVKFADSVINNLIGIAEKALAGKEGE